MLREEDVIRFPKPFSTHHSICLVNSKTPCLPASSIEPSMLALHPTMLERHTVSSLLIHRNWSLSNMSGRRQSSIGELKDV